MDYSKIKLKQLKDLLQEESSEYLQEEAVAFLKTMSEEYLYLAERNILNKNEDALKENIDFGMRISKFFRQEMKDKEPVEFYKGFFCGVFHAIDYIQGSRKDYKKNLIKLQRLYKRDNMKLLLLYLYYHPGAQHKTLARALEFSASYLSELMGELVEEGCAVKYSESKYSYYELTIDSQNFIKARIEAAESDKLPYEVKYDLPFKENDSLFYCNRYSGEKPVNINVDLSMFKDIYYIDLKGEENGKFSNIY